MREGMVICPQRSNTGTPLDHVKAHVMGRMIGAFGGATVTAAEGAWRDDTSGALHVEPVWQIAAAYNPSAAHDATLRDIARDIGAKGEQLAVYLRLASGDVEIIDTAAPALQVAA